MQYTIILFLYCIQMYEELAYNQLDNLLKERLSELEKNVKPSSENITSDPNKLTLEVKNICKKHGIV